MVSLLNMSGSTRLSKENRSRFFVLSGVAVRPRTDWDALEKHSPTAWFAVAVFFADVIYLPPFYAIMRRLSAVARGSSGVGP